MAQPLPPPPPYLTPPQNGSSPISTAPPEVLTTIFQHLPQLACISGEGRSVNRGAILGVSRHWNVLGCKVLSKSMDFATIGTTHGKKRAESWFSYVDRVRENDTDKRPPLVLNLHLHHLSDLSTRLILRSVRGVINLIVDLGEMRPRGMRLPKLDKGADYEIALSQVRSVSIGYVMQSRYSTVNTNWWESPPLEHVRIHSVGDATDNIEVDISHFTSWIFPPTLKTLAVVIQAFFPGREGSLLQRWPDALENLTLYTDGRDSSSIEPLQTLPIKALMIYPPLDAPEQSFVNHVTVVLRHAHAFPNLKFLVIVKPETMSLESWREEDCYKELKSCCDKRGIGFDMEEHRQYPGQ